MSKLFRTLSNAVMFFVKSLNNIFFKHRVEEYLDRDGFFKRKSELS